ncbi:hemagglutinin repeat-containing protein [Erwinia sp. S43]|nr:hemagglutinin repeat-containing protein [Erwinia sp. S43]
MAGNDLTASGSNLLGTNDVTLSAGNNLTLTTAAESDHSASVEQKKKSGFSGSGGIGFSLGNSSQKLTHDESSNVQKGSVAGSSAGSLTLQAGNAATVHGSDLVAGQDLTVQGKNVSITSAENSHTSLTKSESESRGLTVGLSGTVGSALNTAVHQVKAAKKEESGRLAALKGTLAALTGYQAAQAAQLAAEATGNSSDGNIAGLTLSYGKQKSTSEQRQEEHSSSGSQLQAGRDMHITATAGDLNVEGAQLKAGQDMALSASRDISLTSGKNSTQSSGHSSSHGGSVGAGLSVGGVAAGLSLSASASQSRGHENGSSLTHTETTADAGRNLTLNSGRDALLQGAQVSGKSVKADIGRDLLIASEQDRDHYDMKQTGSSVGGSVIGGAGIGGSASLSGSRDKMNSDFASVKEQSGLFAGKGGFDITVGSHTQLDGGVIASTAEKEKNRLDTGTLGWSDIHNQADYKTEHQGAGISSGGSVGGQFVGNMANNTLVGANGSGHDSSTTHAAVEDGTIIIRDKDKQQQDVATLDRDTEHAANGLSPIFDKEKEQKRLQEAQVIGEIGSQAIDIAATQGKILAINAGKAELEAKGIRSPGSDATPEERAAYDRLLTSSSAYKTAQAEWGTGSAIQQGIQAATAAIQGLAGGNVGQLLSGAAAPYLAEQIHKLAPDETSRAMAHAVVGAIVSYEAGNSAAAGAAGAVSGELMAQLVMNQLYPGKQVSALTETEKQTVSVLGTLAAGLAGGITGGSAADGMAGAQAGKNSTDNNALGAAGSDLGFWLGKTPDCDTACKANIAAGVAKGNLIVAAGEVTIVAATAEVAVLARAVLAGCKSTPMICLNDAGIATAEALVPGGVGAGGAIGIGKTAAEAAAAKVEAVAANAVKNNPSWKTGEYLDGFKPSSTPLELVKEQAGKGSQTAYIRMDHILNGEVKTLKDGTKVGSGGHYIRDPNIKIDKVTGTADANGVSTGYISVRDPSTGQWVPKKTMTTFFPEEWSKRQTAQEIESAFKNSEKIPNTEMWSGKSLSGLEIQGYYGKPDGTGATAWPVYGGRKK